MSASPYLEVADRLRRVLPPDAVLADPVQLALYGYDGTVYAGQPDLVALPETTEQVVALIKAAHAAGVPVVARGAATSLSGGPVPVRGGLVVSFSRMDRILALDYPNQRAVVQPGVINQDLQSRVSSAGYFYAPDPASQCVCTLGGNVGENSGGPHCLKYGVTANHILGLEMVLPNGQVLRTGPSLEGPGYDLTGLIVGHEGTLGLVTEITCRLLRQPQAVATMLAIFPSLQTASQTVSDIIAAGIIPATLEMMDQAMIEAVEQALHAGYPRDAAAVLIVEVDGMAAGLEEQVAQIQAITQRHGCTSFRRAADEAERARLWKGRKGAFGAVVNIAPSKICTDISVPRTRLPATLEAVMEIGRRHGVPIANVFHAGDGNLHPLVLFDPRQPGIQEKVAQVDTEITQLALAQGGVLTGEHGIGCCKRKHMTRMFGPAELRAMWRVRQAFDPAGRLNPDKVLPDQSEIPATPDLPAHSPYAALRDQLRATAAQAHKAILRGHGTKSVPPPAGAEVLSLAGLDRVLSFDHENLTVTAQAGITLPALAAVLAERGQRLPLYPRFLAEATLGGVLAANESGPQRLLYGGPRDLLTGLQALLPTGELVRFGSACVKNVAGYAVEKLLLGSRGTLGAIVEATLRTLPQPEVSVTEAVEASAAASVEPLVAALHAAPLRPAAVELLNPPAAAWLGRAGWLLLVAWEGFAAEVAAARAEMRGLTEAAGLGPPRLWEGAPEPDPWPLVTRLGASPGDPALQVAVPLAGAVSLAADLDALDPARPLRASTGLGLVHIALPPTADPTAYQQQAQPLAEARQGVTAWLAPTPDRSLTRLPDPTRDLLLRLKAALDPTALLPPPRC